MPALLIGKQKIKAGSTLNSYFACSYTKMLNVQVYTAQHSHSCNHRKAINFLTQKYSIRFAILEQSRVYVLAFTYLLFCCCHRWLRGMAG